LQRQNGLFIGILVLVIGQGVAGASQRERLERFDRDPGWEGRNNRPAVPVTRAIRQNFGYSRTGNNGDLPGEVGGQITPAAEPAYYAKKLAPETLNDTLSASGTLVFAGPKGHVLLGFFNANTVNEWRTPNTIALRLLGRGDRFLAYVEYATSKWRAGGGDFAAVPEPRTGRNPLAGFVAGKTVHRWAIRYDPNENGGGGAIRVTLDDRTAVCNLDPGHKQDGAVFNRFGLLTVMKSADDAGEVWIDNVTVNGETDDFSRDPGWEGLHNRRTYKTANIRPQFDFGYSPTHYAGGRGRGELGGLVFRGDCRMPDRLACYGDRLQTLTLRKSLKASGRVSLRRGVSDSTTLLGFYHSQDSMTVSDSQASLLPRCFLGIAVEGPSREGFFFAPVCRGQSDARGLTGESGLPHILPDGAPHEWEMEFLPDAGGAGRIRLRFDKQVCALELSAEDLAGNVRFDRFGLITTWIDGNGQHIYFDDIHYTFAQE
jgi:hypothetical protein